MHLTLVDLREDYGLSRWQMKDRLKLLRLLLEPHITSGDNNRILLDMDGVAIFEQFMDWHASGLTLEQAAVQVADDLAREGRDDAPAAVASQLAAI